MKTKEFLSTSISLLEGDRQKDYGDKLHNHTNIAKLWSAYLDIKVSAHDVAILMALLKVARTKLGKVSSDTYVDMASYSAIAGEIKFREKE